MGVIKITFDGSSVSSKQDAVLNHFLCGGIAEGILQGIENELSVSISNNYITFRSGYIQIYGRRIYVEDNTQIHIALDSSKYGLVIIDVNMAQNSVVLSKVESSDGYPALIKENLLQDGNRYQMAICYYHKTTSSITLNSFSKPLIPSALKQASSYLQEAKNYVDSRYNSVALGMPVSQTGNTYKYDLSAFSVSKILVVITIGEGQVITIPGSHIVGHSMAAIHYRLNGKDQILVFEWLPGNIFLLMTGDSFVSIQQVYVYKFGQ